MTATIKPREIPETVNLPRRSATHAAMRPRESNGYICPSAKVPSMGDEISNSPTPTAAHPARSRSSVAIHARETTLARTVIRTKER